MDRQTMIALAITLALVALVLFGVISRIRRGAPSDDSVRPANRPLEPVAIAEITEGPPAANWAGAFAAIALLGFTVIALAKYFNAETANQQLVALLLWIGNCAFWGIFVLAAVISGRGKLTVFRLPQVPVTPSERQEPKL